MPATDKRLSYSAIVGAMTAEGLLARGAFHVLPADQVPADGTGRPAATLILAGHAGSGLWPAFKAGAPAGADPLDFWSRAVLQRLADLFGGWALHPFGGPPHHPFQRWAQRAEAVFPSPIGLLIHPRFGLWHGYRGALALAERIEIPPRENASPPCDSCQAKPCLATCPVDAFKPGAYDVPACIGHLATRAGVDCMTLGCRARRACPVGRDFVYEPEQARHHMRSFLDRTSARLKAGGGA